MQKDKARFARGLLKLVHSMDPLDVMCLCRGVPRSQLAAGDCDMDDCISRHVVDAKAAVGHDVDGMSEMEKYALYQA